MRGLNQRQLAGRLGVPASSIAPFDGGRRKPSFENLHRLAGALEVATDDLLGRVDEPVNVPMTDPLLKDLSKLGNVERELVAAIRKVLSRRDGGRFFYVRNLTDCDFVSVRIKRHPGNDFYADALCCDIEATVVVFAAVV